MPPPVPALVLLQLLLLLLHQAPGTLGIKCQRTETGYQPHSRDCGPTAKGCRILVKPYKVQNNSAVAPCRSDERFGDYIYDCAVDCPAKSQWDWNEVMCCTTGSNCNSNLKDINKINYCYVSKAASNQNDDIKVCAADEKCALNIENGDTSCVKEDVCKAAGKWTCCPSSENCGSMWGIYKPETTAIEEESTQGSHVRASLALSAVSLLVTCLIVP